MIEVICNDRLGKKIRVKCNPDDTVGDLKKLLAAQTGTRPEKLRIQKWYTVYKDHITLEDYEIHDGMGLELYCARMLRCFLFCFLHSSLFLLLIFSLSCCVRRQLIFRAANFFAASSFICPLRLRSAGFACPSL